MCSRWLDTRRRSVLQPNTGGASTRQYAVDLRRRQRRCSRLSDYWFFSALYIILMHFYYAIWQHSVPKYVQ